MPITTKHHTQSNSNPGLKSDYMAHMLTLSNALSSLSSADGQLGAQTLLRASAHSAESVCAKSVQGSLCTDNLRKSAQTVLSIYAHSAQSLCAHSAQSLSVSSLSLDIEILVSKIFVGLEGQAAAMVKASNFIFKNKHRHVDIGHCRQDKPTTEIGHKKQHRAPLATCNCDNNCWGLDSLCVGWCWNKCTVQCSQ